jgi:hypothetical protein
LRTGSSSENASAALVSMHTAVYVPDGAHAYDAIVGHPYDWTAPRAWLVVCLISRLPPDERSRAVERLTVAGGARVLIRRDFDAQFRRLW